MLLSDNTLNQQVQNETKLNRIKSYVKEQTEYAENYQSPNHINPSLPSSCLEDETQSQALDESISIILKRKYSHLDQPQNEQIHKTKENNSTNLPKSNEFHLLDRFISPNLEIDRITLRSKHQKKRVGLFNKGKSSAAGKTVPDLVFSEAQFLKKQIHSTTPPPSPVAEKRHTHSRFFKSSRETTPNQSGPKRPKPSPKDPTPISIHSDGSKAETLISSDFKQHEQPHPAYPYYSFSNTPNRQPSFRPSLFSLQQYSPHPPSLSESLYHPRQEHVDRKANCQTPFDLHWQLTESIDYPESTEKDDLKLVMESPAIHLLNKHLQESDQEIKNFWLTQSYKRKL